MSNPNNEQSKKQPTVDQVLGAIGFVFLGFNIWMMVAGIPPLTGVQAYNPFMFLIGHVFVLCSLGCLTFFSILAFRSPKKSKLIWLSLAIVPGLIATFYYFNKRSDFMITKNLKNEVIVIVANIEGRDGIGPKDDSLAHEIFKAIKENSKKTYSCEKEIPSIRLTIKRWCYACRNQQLIDLINQNKIALGIGGEIKHYKTKVQIAFNDSLKNIRIPKKGYEDFYLTLSDTDIQGFTKKDISRVVEIVIKLKCLEACIRAGYYERIAKIIVYIDVITDDYSHLHESKSIMSIFRELLDQNKDKDDEIIQVLESKTDSLSYNSLWHMGNFLSLKARQLKPEEKSKKLACFTKAMTFWEKAVIRYPHEHYVHYGIGLAYSWAIHGIADSTDSTKQKDYCIKTIENVKNFFLKQRKENNFDKQCRLAKDALIKALSKANRDIDAQMIRDTPDDISAMQQVIKKL